MCDLSGWYDSDKTSLSSGLSVKPSSIKFKEKLYIEDYYLAPARKFSVYSLLKVIRNQFILKSVISRQWANFQFISLLKLTRKPFILKSLISRQRGNFQFIVSWKWLENTLKLAQHIYSKGHIACEGNICLFL